ncbi:DUF1800 domain-containing protein [Paracoccus sp. Z330]|uniref:DUF1800 domain-containing protein n=1 Tax=Paracoccus onchidii TaxID=3017813 RepID=A0ABT4ZDV3_9RHOB|nr:DUF1800 domain-containing protein [Paracoccus onchidii]MDB6177469.1 DUF1800 domain-containing protein [Paracoccus onchidii]
MIDYSSIAALKLGYGLGPDVHAPETPAGLVAEIGASGPDDSSISLDQIEELRLQYTKAVKEMRKNGGGDRSAIRAERRKTVKLGRVANQRRIARAVGGGAGFGERLVQFWADHFTVVGGANIFNATMAAAFVEEAIRPNMTGSFADMMLAAEIHPRMLTYLNQVRSYGPGSVMARKRPDRNLGLNENLAREMIELHSLGVNADYTQKDVRQLAKLLTGLTYNFRNERRFRPAMAEPGPETVLGKSYGVSRWGSIRDVRAVIGDLARHPATADHIAQKLAVHFVSDTPPRDLVARLAASFRETDGNLAELYLTLAEAPELQSNFRAKVRQPFDYIIASLRAVGMGAADVMSLPPQRVNALLIRPMTAMGQKWQLPRGPDGWPEEAEAWATPQGLAARIDWATRQLPKLVRQPPDPRALLRDCLGDTATEPLNWAVPKAETELEGLAVVLGSADFNRR